MVTKMVQVLVRANAYLGQKSGQIIVKIQPLQPTFLRAKVQIGMMRMYNMTITEVSMMKVVKFYSVTYKIQFLLYPNEYPQVNEYFNILLNCRSNV